MVSMIDESTPISKEGSPVLTLRTHTWEKAKLAKGGLFVTSNQRIPFRLERFDFCLDNSESCTTNAPLHLSQLLRQFTRP